MGDKVVVKYEELDDVNTALLAIIDEFNNVEKREDELEKAIGAPYLKYELRDKAHEFEGGWDDRRNALQEDLGKVQQHVKAVVKGFEKWDRETADKFDDKPTDTTGNTPR